MPEPLNLPPEYYDSFRRLLPYIAAPLRNEEAILHSILLYLKLGNEKLARIVIEAYNENHRLLDLENRRKMREQALLMENLEEESEEEEADFENDDEEDQDDQDDS